MLKLEVRPNPDCPCNCRICILFAINPDDEAEREEIGREHIVQEGVDKYVDFLTKYWAELNESFSVQRLDVN